MRHTRTYPKLHEGQDPLCSVQFYTTSTSIMLKPQLVLKNSYEVKWQVVEAVELQSNVTLKHNASSCPHNM